MYYLSTTPRPLLALFVMINRIRPKSGQRPQRNLNCLSTVSTHHVCRSDRRPRVALALTMATSRESAVIIHNSYKARPCVPLTPPLCAIFIIHLGAK
ncbi:unnamed protein product [Soboliphyme baturini]|uniref:Secreted protein n=1 Tax=Soboliphyme baturini TaxID=241478 RepID=A0A183IP79_9BILA|nr:unnamed protein product [Soboliphyme baturini]